jgi:hypothetical protein
MSSAIVTQVLRDFASVLDTLGPKADEIMNALADNSVSYTKKQKIIEFLEKQKSMEDEFVDLLGSSKTVQETAPVKKEQVIAPVVIAAPVAPVAPVATIVTPVEQKAFVEQKELVIVPKKTIAQKQQEAPQGVSQGVSQGVPQGPSSSSQPAKPQQQGTSYATIAKKTPVHPLNRPVHTTESQAIGSLKCPDELRAHLNPQGLVGKEIVEKTMAVLEDIQNIVKNLNKNTHFEKINFSDGETGTQTSIPVLDAKARDLLGESFKRNRGNLRFPCSAIMYAANNQFKGSNPPYIACGLLMIVSSLLDATNNTEYIPGALMANLHEIIASRKSLMDDYKQTIQYYNNLEQYGADDNTKGVDYIIEKCAENIIRHFKREKLAYENAQKKASEVA